MGTAGLEIHHTEGSKEMGEIGELWEDRWRDLVMRRQHAKWNVREEHK
jgi:hypothetical protein